mmetsp:Transcript_36075/g.103813  ORF Transcript_36075/g.103813 Transcript_36075/m.103813 type:complete len:460 (-) Transcript_36075:108-1487(-)
MGPRGAAAAAASLAAGVGLLLPAAALPPCDVTKSGDDICDDFCSYRCSFYNHTAGERPGPRNITLYRLTPANVTGIRNKNTGDPNGDVGYWLGKKNTSLMCAQEPSAFGCFGTDQMIYGRFTVEVDGEWGSYTECNPLQLGGDDPLLKPAWKDSRRFVCGTSCLLPTEDGCHSFDPSPYKNGSSGGWGPECRCDGTSRELRAVARVAPEFLREPDGQGIVPASWGAQCEAGYRALPRGWCLHGRAYEEVKGWSLESALSLACDACRVNPNCTGWTTWDDRTVKLFQGRMWPFPGRCRSAGAELGPWNKQKSWFGVGKLGGHWFTTPVGGECPKGKPLGHAGCTWREVASVYKNATCVDGRVDRSVEAWGAACFRRCPSPLNRTSDCYMDCYRDVIMGNAATNITRIPSDRILRPWIRAFSEEHPRRGGCPVITPRACDGDQCDPLVPSGPWLDESTFVV